MKRRAEKAQYSQRFVASPLPPVAVFVASSLTLAHHSPAQMAEEKSDNQALQIEQQDMLLGKEDLEKTYELDTFMEQNIKDKDTIDLIKKLVKFKQEERIGAKDGACEIMQVSFE